jgi:hypothetical protein
MKKEPLPPRAVVVAGCCEAPVVASSSIAHPCKARSGTARKHPSTGLDIMDMEHLRWATTGGGEG